MKVYIHETCTRMKCMYIIYNIFYAVVLDNIVVQFEIDITL